MDYKPTVVFDFDGVIHSYTSGWKGVTKIPDPPCTGIKQAIQELRDEGYRVVVVSTRSETDEGRVAIYRYLNKWDIVVDDVSATKPPALCYIDDRAIRFDGDAYKLKEEIINFKTWIEKEGDK